MDRRIVLAVVAAVAVLSALVGWVAGQRIKSPAEIAAEAAPPPPSLITVPVELRTLSQNVVIRGTVTPSDETELPASSTSGSSVITRLPKEAGAAITEGDVIVEVSGRPMIALQGRLPAFRNLIPGLNGPEVRQLEEALVRLGYQPGDVDTAYTSTTAAAVEALYRDRGYIAPESDAADAGALKSASDNVMQQEQAVKEAKDALTEAEKPVPASEKARLDLTVSQEQFAVSDAESMAASAKAEAATAVTEAQKARDAAATAAASGGADEQAALAEAEAALTAARNDQPRTTTEQDLLVAGAKLSLTDAQEARTARLAPPNLTALRASVSSAENALSEARTEVTEAQARVGAWLPTSEVVFFTSLPRQVGQVFVEVGDMPTASIMTISGAETLIESGISSAQRRLIEVGAEATLEDDDLGISITAVVTFVADNPGGPNLSADRYALRLEPVDEVPEDAVNVNLRISIPITSSGGDVLAVPLAALSAGPDGTARVEVERTVGQTEIVEVSTGLRAEGLVQIEPLAAPLAEGDRVVVGRDLVLPGSEAGSDEGSGTSGEDEGGS